MRDTLGKTRILVDCLRRAAAIARRSGGVEALEKKLAELERDLGAAPNLNRCPQCGSTELEPIWTEPTTGGVVSRFRCKACGGEVSCG